MRMYIWHIIYLVVVALAATCVVLLLRWKDESREFSFNGQRYAPIGPISEMMQQSGIPTDEKSPLKVGIRRCWGMEEPGCAAVVLVRAEFHDSYGRLVHRDVVLMETPCQERCSARIALKMLASMLAD